MPSMRSRSLRAQLLQEKNNVGVGRVRSTRLLRRSPKRRRPPEEPPRYIPRQSPLNYRFLGRPCLVFPGKPFCRRQLRTCEYLTPVILAICLSAMPPS